MDSTIKPGYKTTEFGATVVVVATQVIVQALVLLGYTTQGETEKVTTMVSSAVAQVALLGWYVMSRAQVKSKGTFVSEVADPEVARAALKSSLKQRLVEAKSEVARIEAKIDATAAPADA